MGADYVKLKIPVALDAIYLLMTYRDTTTL